MSQHTRIQTKVTTHETLRSPRGNLHNSPQQATNRESKRWPDVRLIRAINRTTKESANLSEYVDDLGERNYGLGHGRALGSMALTLVDAQTMGRMFDYKYRNWGTDRQQAKKTVKSFSKYFNQFVRRQEKLRIDAQNERMDTLQGCVRGDCDSKQDELLLQLDEDFLMQYPKLDNLHEMRWNMSSFSLKRNLNRFGTFGMGLDLTGNEQLHQEFDDTVVFLREEGLNTQFVTHNRQGGRCIFMPHIVVFDCFDAAENVELLSKIPIPDDVSLLAPSAKMSNI